MLNSYLSSMIISIFVVINEVSTDILLQMKPFLINKRIKKGWIWLKRFRHRKGYGVHSPFAFDFITRVIYGKSYPEGRRSFNGSEPKKVKKLLARLEKEASLLVYVNKPDDPIYINKVYNDSVGKMPQDGMFVVYGIYENNGMRQLWQQLLSDTRSGITFDLYEIGIILFDKKITKQDYIVNF